MFLFDYKSNFLVLDQKTKTNFFQNDVSQPLGRVPVPGLEALLTGT